MQLFEAAHKIDIENLEQPEIDLEVKYGLPKKIKFCKRCVISNQRPNSAIEYQHNENSKKHTIHFDEEGVCDACRVAEQKEKKIDWNEREKELLDLCNRHRSKNGSYDCLVPGSGGKDSFYASHVLKYKYGMHPLTVTWAPHIYTEWGWHNFQAWIHSGFNNYLMTPDGKAHRLLTRLSLENMLHPFQPFMIGQKALAPKMALQFNIPLVFFGENEAEYGNPISDAGAAKRDNAYFTTDVQSNIYLGGTPISDLKQYFGLKNYDIEPYMPADADKIRQNSIEVHYLGFYLPWHPQENYYYSVEHGNFQPSPERTPGTYSKYNSIDDRIDDFHYYTTFIKFGIGRATYDASQEIRNNEITREEGVALVKKFDGEFPERFLDEILSYLSIPESEFPEASQMFEQPTIDRDYFSDLCDRFRSPHLWKKENGSWKLRLTVFNQ